MSALFSICSCTLPSSEALATLGESLHQLLTGLEEVGVEALPQTLESEMRRAMSLSPSLLALQDDCDSSMASSIQSQFGTPLFGLSPSEEVAFSSLLQRMIAGTVDGMMAEGCDLDDCLEGVAEM